MTDFNSSANISAGHPKKVENMTPNEIAELISNQPITIYHNDNIPSEHLRRLRSIKVALDSILIQVKHGIELVDLLLEEECGTGIVYTGVDKLMRLGFTEQDAHYWIHKSHKVAVSIPFSPYLSDEERAKDNKFLITVNRAPFPLIDETPASRDWVTLDKDKLGYMTFAAVYTRLVEILADIQ